VSVGSGSVRSGIGIIGALQSGDSKAQLLYARCFLLFACVGKKQNLRHDGEEVGSFAGGGNGLDGRCDVLSSQSVSQSCLPACLSRSALPERAVMHAYLLVPLPLSHSFRAPACRYCDRGMA
jgi:hypothetical protein